MSKAANIAKISAKGGFNLLWGMVASTIVSALGTIVVANLLGAANYGLYTIALVGPSLLSLFSDLGIGRAIIKYTAQYNTEDKAASIRSIFTAGILFETTLGITLAVVCFLLSGFFAKLYSLPNITPLIQIASFTILLGALFSTAQAAFTGIEKFEPDQFHTRLPIDLQNCRNPRPRNSRTRPARRHNRRHNRLHGRLSNWRALDVDTV